ncbi:BTB/POZ domain-containing protein [Aspergillus neoniger CBS 115656]|uniref:BTB domain-containing protein n=1 Tax=Aspergillus neoniger (strain CBS 115656) TaxID=1448310 RepID=A0A318YBY8_ASPNB|nr:hypothetical protein BO87DRAFT_409969 [Aspergillus neoniger CBS 115656]PYH30200.1 hypothetical protein BO87DRAFT_409969 [Aspergillus neoniger CBS 115656]
MSSSSEDARPRGPTKVISDLFLNSTWSDLSIVCGDVVFPAHKCVVCPQSGYFSRACNRSFIESSGKIVIEDLEPIYLEKTLQFLYKGFYTRLSDVTTSPAVEFGHPSPIPSPIVRSLPYTTLSSVENGGLSKFHVHMYEQGEYFQIHDLKEKAKEHFKECFLRDLDRLFFRSTVNEVYCSTIETDRGLRDIVIETVLNDLPTLIDGTSTYLDKEDLQEMPEFTVDLCQASLVQNAYLMGIISECTQ